MQGASDAPLLSSLLLPLWAPLIEAAHLLNPFAATPLSSFNWGCSPFESFTATPSSSFNWCCSPFESFTATPLSSFNWCCSPFESFTATPSSSFNWCCSPFEVFAATPLSFLFCYPFGLSLLLPLWDFLSSRPSSFQWKLEKNEAWALGEPQLYNSEAMPLTYSVGCHD